MGKKKSRTKHKNSNRPQDLCNGEVEEPSSDIKEAQDLSNYSDMPKEDCTASPTSGQKMCPEPCAATETSGSKEELQKNDSGIMLTPQSTVAPQVLEMETKQGVLENSLSVSGSHMIANTNDVALSNVPPSPVNLGQNATHMIKNESVSQSVLNNQNVKSSHASSGDTASVHTLPANLKQNTSDFSNATMECTISPDGKNDPSSTLLPSRCSTVSEKEICSSTQPNDSGVIPQKTHTAESVGSSVPAVEVVGNNKKDKGGRESEKVQSDTSPIKDMRGCENDPNSVTSHRDFTGVKYNDIAKRPVQNTSKMKTVKSPKNTTAPSELPGGEKTKNSQDFTMKNPGKVNERGPLVNVCEKKEAEKKPSQVTHDSKADDEEKETKGNSVTPVSSGTETDGSDVQNNVTAKVESQQNANSTDLTVATNSKLDGKKVEQLPCPIKTNENQKKNDEKSRASVSSNMKAEPITPTGGMAGVDSPMTKTMPNQEDKSTATINKKTANQKKNNNKQKMEKSDSSAETKVKGQDSNTATTESCKNLVEEHRITEPSSTQLEGSNKNVIPADKPASTLPEVSKENTTPSDTQAATKIKVVQENVIPVEKPATTNQEPTKENLMPVDKPAVAQQGASTENTIPADKPAVTKLEASKEEVTPADKPTAANVEVSQENTILADEPAAAQQEASKEKVIAADKPAAPKKEASKENKIPAEKPAATKQESSKENVIQGEKPATRKQEVSKKNMRSTDKSTGKKMESPKESVIHGEKHAAKKQETPKKNVNPAEKPAASEQENSKDKVTPADQPASANPEDSWENVIPADRPAAAPQETSKEIVIPVDHPADMKQEASKENVIAADKISAKKQEPSNENVLHGGKSTPKKQEASEKNMTPVEKSAAKRPEASEKNVIPVEKHAAAKQEASKEIVIPADKLGETKQEASKKNVIQEEKPTAKKQEASKKNVIQEEKPTVKKQEVSKKTPVEKHGASMKETSEENVIPMEESAAAVQEASNEIVIPKDKPVETKPEASMEIKIQEKKPATKKQEASKKNVTPAEKPAAKRQEAPKKNIIPVEKHAATKPETSEENLLLAEKSDCKKQEESKETIQGGNPTTTPLEMLKENVIKGETPAAKLQKESKENVIPADKTAANKREASKENVSRAEKPAAKKQEALKKNMQPENKISATKDNLVQREKPTATQQQASKEIMIAGENTAATKQEASQENLIPAEKPAVTKQEASKEKATQGENTTALQQQASKENVIKVEKPIIMKQESDKNVIPEEKPATTKQEASKDNEIIAEKPAAKKQEASKKNGSQGEKPAKMKQETSTENLIPAEKPEGKKKGESKENVIHEEKPAATKHEASKKNVIPAEKPAVTKQEASKKNVIPIDKPATKKQEVTKKNVRQEEKPAATKLEASKEKVIQGEKFTASKEIELKGENPAGTKPEASKENVIQGAKLDIPSNKNPALQTPSSNSSQSKDQSSGGSKVNEGVSTKCTQISQKTETGPENVKETQSGTKSKSSANDPSSAKKKKENKKQVISNKTGEVQSSDGRKSIPVPEAEHAPVSNDKKSTAVIQKTNVPVDATLKGLEKLFFSNDNETFQARPIFMANTCHVCKSTHGGETRLKTCSACRLIAYCSKEHQRMHWKEHKPLCQQVQKRIKKSGQQDLYGDAHKITDAEEWRKYRCFHIVDAEKHMGRPLMPFEREMFLYPRICSVCHKSDPEKLKVCKGCHFINYCTSEHLPISHKVWCKDLKLLLQLNQYQSRYGMLRPHLPHINLDSTKPFPKSMKDLFSASLLNERNSPHFSLYECVLSDIATCPLTVCHSLNLLNSVNQSNIPKNLIIHLVGAENQFEVEPMGKWDAFLLNLLPHVEKLHLVFVGPELEPTSLDEVNDNGYQIQEIKTINSSKKLTAEFYYGQLYHNYVNASSFVRPNLICAFNCGIYRFTGYNNKDTWGPTITSMVKDTNIPVLLTAYTEVEAPKDVARFKKQCSAKELISPVKNPFASMRPNLNFVSDDETPLIYKNQFLSVVKGCDK